MSYSKLEYDLIINLFISQDWLTNKESELNELLTLCDDIESKKLIFSLLERFKYLYNNDLNELYLKTADYITRNTGFDDEKTQIVALTFDHAADSAQRVLDIIKIYVSRNGWSHFETVNSFGRSKRIHSRGKTQIVLIDEFIGSGKTLKTRLDYLKKQIIGAYEIRICYLVGMRETIEYFSNAGVEIFCPLQLDKGINGFYKDDELNEAESLMLKLELKLAQKINSKDIYDFSFGFGMAEALYTSEGANGNTPNSVFPIFWWPKNLKLKLRNTILSRYEQGF